MARHPRVNKRKPVRTAQLKVDDKRSGLYIGLMSSLFTVEDSNKIKNLYSKSEASKLTLSEMSSLERIRETTDLYRFRRRLLQKGYGISMREVLDVFVDLEKAGFGRLVIGQTKGTHTTPHRFIWGKYNIQAVGQEATKNAVMKAAKETKRAVLSTEEAQGSGQIAVLFQSRSGSKIKLRFQDKEEIQDMITLLQDMLS